MKCKYVHNNKIICMYVCIRLSETSSSICYMNTSMHVPKIAQLFIFSIPPKITEASNDEKVYILTAHR